MSNGAHDHRVWKEIIAVDPRHPRRCTNRWRGFVREGHSISGEVRLTDTMAPRHARILDVGCGQGRVGGYLAKVGHQVVGVDVNPYLIDEAKRQLLDVMRLVGDLAQLPHAFNDGPESTPHDGTASAFNVITCPDNVLTFVAPKDHTKVLQVFAAALNPEGSRAIIGFNAGHGWDFADFEAIAQETGLTVIQRYSAWDLRPFEDESQLLVAVLERG